MSMLELFILPGLTWLTPFRFGNYIGEAAESDEELEQVDVKPQAFKYDEAFGADDDEEASQQELMEVDGALPLRLH